jgi:RNA polymerase sigma-70 factor (ECF subfamily)
MDFFFLILAALRFAEEPRLAQAIRRRDPGAMNELYTLYAPLVLRLINRITRNPAASEDILQDTFMRVWTESDRIQGNAQQIGPWILVIARNRALDYLRAPQQSRTVTQGASEGLESSLLASGDSAEDSLINDENQHRVAKALRDLDPRHKQVIELAYYNGLSHSQIAAHLNQPLGTVKSWTRAALLTLRAALKEGNRREI